MEIKFIILGSPRLSYDLTAARIMFSSGYIWLYIPSVIKIRTETLTLTIDLAIPLIVDFCLENC